MKTIIALLSILLLAACDSPVEKPDRLIDEKTMIDIFYDLALLDAIKSQKPLALTINNINPNQYIYTKYKIDRVQFAQSNRFYASDINQYKKMYAEVGKRFQDNVTKIESTQRKSPKKDKPSKRTPAGLTPPEAPDVVN